MIVRYIPFRPTLDGYFATRFYDKAQTMVSLRLRDELESLIEGEVTWATTEAKLNPRQRSLYRAAWLLLRDIIRVGWLYRWNDGTLEVAHPVYGQQSYDRVHLLEVKSTLRKSMSEVRKQKIAEVPDFINRMESVSSVNNRGVSVMDLIADGRELATSLRRIAQIQDQQVQLTELRGIIRPYLQLVEENERCTQTGLRLGDIWRYFRFTWANPHENTPGRTLQYLIRDASRPNHPVMGIASLGNTALRIECRDYHFGWTLKAFKEEVESSADNIDRLKTFQRLLRNIELALVDIDIQGLCSGEDIMNPSPQVLQRLKMIAARSAIERQDALREWSNRGETDITIERSDLGNISVAVEEALYKRKRAEHLYNLLSAKMTLKSQLESPDFAWTWSDFTNSESGQRAIWAALVAAKNRHIGTSMLEVNVCGAIPPYNEILAGKLTALVMLSPQVVHDYRKRYGDRPSDIASKLKGEPVIRAADLVYLGTTSLYSVGSSQYNRLKLPAKLLSPSGHEIRWDKLGITKGYGTLHISKATLQSLLEISHEGFTDINHIFGEGASPKLRAITQGLGVLFGTGQNSAARELSRHAMSRIVYGAWLVSNGFEYLNNIDGEPQYYFDISRSPSEGTERIVDYWRERWLLKRLQHIDIYHKLETFDPELLRISRDLPEAAATQFTPIQREVEVMPSSESTRPDSIVHEYLENLYRGSSAYADRIDPDLLEAIHVDTHLDQAIVSAATNGKHVVLTGNPGDGKTHLLRIQEPRLIQLGSNPEIELDASRLRDEVLFSKWQAAHNQGRPFCVAVNEAVLFKLARSYPDFEPLQEACFQAANGVVYDDISVESNSVVVFDLSQRNILSGDIVNRVVDKITDRSLASSCEECHYAECDYIRHTRILQSERFRTRLQQLFNRVSRRGYHATLREVQAFFSYLLFGGRNCTELRQSSGDMEFAITQLVYNGEGKLFDAIRNTFDPAGISHPIWDEVLINAATNAQDWLVDGPTENDAIDPGNIQRFNARKRAFYFCHAMGEDILKIAGDDESGFGAFLNSSDRDILRLLLRRINRFFGDTAVNDEIRVWESHRFDQSPRRIFYSSLQRQRRDFEIVRPRLNNVMLSAFDGANDHVILKLRNGNKAKLRVDFDMFQVLAQAERGLPVMLLENDTTRRLWQFMERLIEPFGVDRDEVEVRILDPVTGEQLQVTVDAETNQFLAITGRD